MANTFSASFVQSSSQDATRSSNLGITGGAITIEAWINPASLPSVNFNIIARQSDAGTHVGYAIALWNNGGTQQIAFDRNREGVGGGRISYSITLSTSAWYHIAGTYDGTNMRLYYAAQADSGHTLVAGPTSDTGNGSTGEANLVDIGFGSAPAPHYWDGLIDEVRFWSAAQSLGQLDANWKVQLTGTETNLNAYYRFNNNWNDTTPNAYNLTPNNSPTFSSNVPFTGQTGPANLKTWDGIAEANLKTIQGVALASVKSWNGIT